MDVFLIDLYFKYDYKARDHCKVWSSIMTYFISGNNIIKGPVHIKSKLIHYVCFFLQCSYDVSRKNGGVGDHHLLQCLVPCTESEHSCTVKCGLNEQLPFFVYRLKLYTQCIGGKNETALYRH